MTVRRLLVFYAVIGVILTGSAFDIVMDSEHWPFSSYRMYSGVVTDRSLTMLRLFGVDELLQEIPLLANRYIEPFDQSRLRIALTRLTADPDSLRLLRDALLDCLRRYELLRRAGRHSGPPLQRVRLYRLYWILDPWARNVEEPDDHELVMEVMRPSGTVP